MNFNRLKLALTQKGFTHQDLADRLDLTRQAVHRIFQIESLRVSQLEEICKILEISPAILFDDSPNASSSESKELIQTMKDKMKLLEDIIKLLREQLAECKAKVDKQAALT